MEYATIIFIRVLSGICQQGLFSPKKRRDMVSAWQTAVKNSDKGTLEKLLNENLEATDNKSWRQDLLRAIEEL